MRQMLLIEEVPVNADLNHDQMNDQNTNNPMMGY